MAGVFAGVVSAPVGGFFGAVIGYEIGAGLSLVQEQLTR